MPKVVDEGLVRDAEHKMKTWMLLFKNLSRLYWSCGVLALVASALAGSRIISDSAVPYVTLLSTLCVGIIGFVDPERRGRRFLRAFRVVDAALLDYKYGPDAQPNTDASAPLRAAMNDAERTIAQYEEATPAPTPEERERAKNMGRVVPPQPAPGETVVTVRPATEPGPSTRTAAASPRDAGEQRGGT
jgi:hypothetical protein